MYQDGIFWNIEFHATQTSKRTKHPVIKTSGHPHSPSKPNKTNMPTQFTRSDTGSEMPFIFFFPVLSLNISANVEAPFGKENLKQIFLGHEKRDHHAWVLIRQWRCPWESVCSQRDYYNICLSGNIIFVGLELEQ